MKILETSPEATIAELVDDQAVLGALFQDQPLKVNYLKYDSLLICVFRRMRISWSSR